MFGDWCLLRKKEILLGLLALKAGGLPQVWGQPRLPMWDFVWKNQARPNKKQKPERIPSIESRFFLVLWFIPSLEKLNTRILEELGTVLGTWAGMDFSFYSLLFWFSLYWWVSRIRVLRKIDRMTGLFFISTFILNFSWEDLKCMCFTGYGEIILAIKKHYK